jgi:hypothetical protein
LIGRLGSECGETTGRFGAKDAWFACTGFFYGLLDLGFLFNTLLLK